MLESLGLRLADDELHQGGCVEIDDLPAAGSSAAVVVAALTLSFFEDRAAGRPRRGPSQGASLGEKLGEGELGGAEPTLRDEARNRRRRRAWGDRH